MKDKTGSFGSCLCGEVKFEIIGEFDSFYLCHCGWCQKDTGSAHSANLFSQTAKLKWISGENKVINYNLPSTQHYKSFCSICGSSLPNIQMDGKLLVVPAGSLKKVSVKPTAHIFISRKANWDKDLEKVKMFDKLPEEVK